MEKTFADSYLSAPENVKNFIFSDDFIAFYEEMVKKFEMDEETDLNFVYLLQDLVVKFIEPKDQVELKDIIKLRLNYDDEKAKQLSYHIWSRFKYFIDKIWEGKEEKKEEGEELLERIIRKEPEIPKPKASILNLKKIIPPKKEKVKPINLQEKIEKTEEEPKITDTIKKTVSWEPPKPIEEGSNVVIIKKKEEKKDEKNKKIIDLSNF
ncbi:MAG: hypothetical protein ACP5JU_01875 [Minisyncoccia bacterium]